MDSETMRPQPTNGGPMTIATARSDIARPSCSSKAGPHRAGAGGVGHRRGTPRSGCASLSAAGSLGRREQGSPKGISFIGGTAGRRTAAGLASISAVTACSCRHDEELGLGVAPVGVNLIAAGFVGNTLLASLLSDQPEARRDQFRTTLPIHHVVGLAAIAALAVHIMTNMAVDRWRTGNWWRDETARDARPARGR